MADISDVEELLYDGVNARVPALSSAVTITYRPEKGYIAD